MDQAINSAVISFMEKYQISQGTVCVIKGDDILDHQGFGTDKDTVFRIGSITKFFTRIAILKLVEQGKLSLDDKAFLLLNLEPLEGEKLNPQLNEITTQHLIDHQAGWDSQVEPDPLFQQKKVAQSLSKPVDQLTPDDIVRYMLNRPLQFEPGSKRSYSGFGYCVLGRVIEKVSGVSYGEFIKTNITRTLELGSVQLGRTKKEETLPNEANYEKDSGTDSPEDPYDPNFLNLEINDSAGGLVSNSLDLCKFLGYFWADGRVRKDGESRYFYTFGRMVGTLALALQRRDGINLVVLLNSRCNRDNQKDQDLQIALEEALDKNP